jgi:hypothetical protein
LIGWIKKYEIATEDVIQRVIAKCGFLRLTQQTGGITYKTAQMGTEITTDFHIEHLLEQIKDRTQLQRFKSSLQKVLQDEFKEMTKEESDEDPEVLHVPTDDAAAKLKMQGGLHTVAAANEDEDAASGEGKIPW